MINALTDHPPVTVPCYAAVHDSRSGRSCVVLQDLSETHTPPVTRGQQVGIAEGVPARVKIDQVMDTLAKLHAYWFDNPRLKRMGFDVGYWSRNEERFGKYLQRRRTAWEDLISGEGSWFPQDLRALYERVFDCLADHWQRYLQPRFDRRIDLTLVHGDAYFANFLCPIGDAPGPAYLLDWQSPTCDVGGYDLANLLATFWTPAQRMAEEREVRALRRYHSVLQSHGIQSDSWDDLTTDYRSGLIFWLLMPVQDRYGKAKRDYWWPKMQCLVAAFRDWDCEDLLRSS
ncbi:MAG TPA: phosphotransferase [Chloroflexota bacterium]|nr:phosphotransferase [Chloroflexota bacterium]